MLTQEDLQAISTIIDQRLDARIGPILEEKMGSIIDQRLDEKMGPIIDQKLKPIKSDIGKIRKDVSILIKRTDEADVKLAKRVTRIEKHVGLSTV